MEANEGRYPKHGGEERDSPGGVMEESEAKDTVICRRGKAEALVCHVICTSTFPLTHL
jgi:hypothetical protein